MKESTKVGIVITFCFFVAWLDRMAINITLPDIAKDLSLTAPQMGFVLSAFFLGYASCQIIGGILSDKYGPRPVILFSLLWWSVFTAATGAADTYEQMVAARFLFGLGEGLFPACVWKIISGWYPRKQRATANSIILSMIALGPALTPLLLGAMLPHVGWRHSFFILGGLGLGSVFLAHRYLYSDIFSCPKVSEEERTAYREAEEQSHSTKEKTLASSSFSELLKSPLVWLLFGNGLIMNIAMYGWLSWLPTYLMKSKGLDLRATIAASSVPFFFGAVGCVAAGYISDRFFVGKRKNLVVMTQIAGSVALFSFTHINNSHIALMAQSFAAFFLFMACGAIWSLPVALLPPKLMGSGSGFINTGGQLGGFFANILIGYYISFRHNNFAAGFDVMLGALGLSTLLVAFFVREATGTSESSRSSLQLTPTSQKS